MTKPNFLIIGAQRCGTTSLYNYLIQHPQIVPSSKKEVHFFDLNFHLGQSWYEKHFPEVSDNILTGEASPYYIFHPLCPKRIFDYDPSVKLIVILRNPIDRAYSHYRHIVRLGHEPLKFEDALI